MRQSGTYRKGNKDIATEIPEWAFLSMPREDYEAIRAALVVARIGTKGELRARYDRAIRILEE